MHHLKIASARGSLLLLAAGLVSILNACDSDSSNADAGSAPCDGSECSDAGCAGPACDDAQVDEQPQPDAGPDAAPPEAPCSEGDDCDSGICDDGACAEASCDDGVRNGDESDIDCGGACEACDDDRACASDGDCASGVCSDEACAIPSCDDETRNGAETDVDCGGGCGECSHGAGCESDEDCATGHCDETCVTEPVAGFRLSVVEADVGQEIEAISTAAADGEIASIEYDWGDGFTDEVTHAYSTVGERMVTQRVTDEHGLTTTTTHALTVFRPVKMSETDKTDRVFVLDGGLTVGQLHALGTSGGGRSDTSIAPGSGVYYFEATRLGRKFYYRYGLATGALAFDMVGFSNQAIVANAAGGIDFNSQDINGGDTTVAGFVVDYRGTNPTVYVLTEDFDTPDVRTVQTLPVTVPLFAVYAGQPGNHGPAVTFNFGSDTVNHPFTFDPVALLTADGYTEVASELVLGFGQTRARTPSEAPEIDAGGDMSIAAGTEVTLTATATDAEDGDLTEQIEWENLATSIMAREKGTGGSFTFTLPEVGRYPIVLSVRDSYGVLTQHRILIEATGTLPQHDPVRLEAHEGSGEGIVLSPDGLSALYTVNTKAGIRANQGNFGRFWYFEHRRLITPSENTGAGVVVKRGSLNPMVFETMQPSVQLNGGGLFDDLVHYTNISSAQPEGWAVDYRGENPIVYVIVNNVLQATMVLEDVWVPLYPMVYGNPTGNAAPYDARVNFGATPFELNPILALTNAGIDTTGLELGWGDANIPD